MNKKALVGWLLWLIIGLAALLLVGSVIYLAVHAIASNTVIVPSDNNNNITVPNGTIILGVPQTNFIKVTTTSPLDLAKYQGLNNNILVTFNEAMNSATVNENTFMVKGPDNEIVNGVITSDATKKIWIFNPTNSLKLDSVYTITITTGVKGVSGNSLVENFVWSFTTASGSGGGGGGSSLVLTTITLTPTSSTLVVGDSQQLSAAGLDQNGNSITTTITYTSSNDTVANVSSSGLVTSKAVGSTTITATSGTISNTSTISVGAAPYLTTITLSPTSTNLTINATKQLTVNATDQSNHSITTTVTYTSSNTSVATVNATTGLVTAVAIGNTTITGANGTVNGTSIIYINSLTKINLLPTSTNLTINATKQLNATDQLGNSINTIITYNSSNTTVATVSSSGLVTAYALGNTTINASSGDISNTSMIYVNSLTGINLLPTSVNLSVGSTKQLNATDQLGNPITTLVTYTSSNTSVATVNATTGLVTAVAIGNTTINASSGDISNTSIIYVLATSTGCSTTAVDLGTAGNFAILAKSGVSTTGVTSITGDIGVSPAAATYMTGFGLIMDPSNQWSTSSLVTGKLYAATYTAPTPATMTTAVSDMETAYNDAAGRTNPCFTELGDGNIGGLTITPGLYKWGTGVLIPTDVTLAGNATDIWVFQIAGTLDISSAKNVTLSGGALAKNIFWQVAGKTTLGTTSVFNGNILSGPGVAVDEAIVLNTGATLNGRALSQKAVTLDANSVTKPTG